MRIAIFGSEYQQEDQVKEILSVLNKYNVEIHLKERFHDYLQANFALKYNIGGFIKDNKFDTDIVISMGGDGTFLRAATKIGKKGIPILGVNTGRLGFLADTAHEDFEEAIKNILDGKYRIEERTQLMLVINEPLIGGSKVALNEIAILKQDSASMITVSVSINGEYLTAYEADGLLVATPTGSTAYAMSVGGPILSPTISNFILTPVASHSLNSRPLVVDDNCEITMEVESRNGSFLISLDGRSTPLSTDIKFKIVKAPYTLKVIKTEGQTFYNTLRNKLMWGSDPRNQ